MHCAVLAVFGNAFVALPFYYNINFEIFCNNFFYIFYLFLKKNIFCYKNQLVITIFFLDDFVNSDNTYQLNNKMRSMRIHLLSFVKYCKRLCCHFFVNFLV